MESPPDVKRKDQEELQSRDSFFQVEEFGEGPEDPKKER